MKKIIISIFIFFIIYLFLNSVLTGVLKLLIIPFIIFAIGFVGYLIKLILLDNVKSFTKEQIKTNVRVENERKEEEKINFFREYDKNIKPLYLKAKDLFTNLMKEGKIRKHQIMDFKKLIDNCLGVHVNYYHNYKFKNDANEIYVKMKNFNLNKYDWERILNFLNEINSNPIVKN